MRFTANLYAGWWVVAGLAGLGLALFLASYGGIGLWLGLFLVAALPVAALLGLRGGFDPQRRLVADLAEEGLSLSRQPPGTSEPIFLPWETITDVRIRPQPGYWQTFVRTADRPDDWLWAGVGLELAETIAHIADLPYAGHEAEAGPLGVTHRWSRAS
ncbi:MAG: hypothetical protein N2383_04260 [Caldilineales bacterium]|nr:hypothetical protein [Caldilineales bacterium]